MPRQTDDQAARAREAEACRCCARRCVGQPTRGSRRCSTRSWAHAGRDRLRGGLDGLGRWRGAEQAAAWLRAVAADRRTAAGGEPAAAEPGLGVRLRRAWIFAASVPRTLLRVARQAASRPRTRLELAGVGLGERHQAELERALAGSGEQPERVLVVTDRLDFAPLLRAGVGFEHVPAEGEPQPRLTGGPYAEFRARRLELIRARRPRGRRVVELD